MNIKADVISLHYLYDKELVIRQINTVRQELKLIEDKKQAIDTFCLSI